MKPNQILFIIVMLCVGSIFSTVQAQDVYVYSKIGKFFVRKGKKDVPVNVQTQLSRNDILLVPAKGKIVLFDPTNRKEIEIRTSYEGISSVDKLINNNETTTVRRLTDMYFRFLCHQMIDSVDKEGNENVPTAVVRDMELANGEIPEEPEDDQKYLDD